MERARRTHTEEFYELTDSSFDLIDLNKALREWERIYDTVRPNPSATSTPQQFLQQYHHNRKGVMCH